MRKYWLHRISHLANVSYPLLENGYLSIGFSDFCYKDFLEKVCISKDWNYMEEEIKKCWGELPRIRYNLWRFISEMKKGDWVVVPSWGSFSIYEVKEDEAILANDCSVVLPAQDWNGRRIIRDSETNLIRISDEKDYLDLGFLRKVSLVEKDIPREGFADSALTSRMKIRGTNADISDLEVSIMNSLDSFRMNKPINLKAQILEKSLETWESVILDSLNPSKFEKLVRWYFDRVGATETYIPPKNYEGKQGDVDVIAVFEKIKTIINVQVKFYRGETSTWAIEQIKDFSEAKESSYEGYIRQYWVITSSDSFSQESTNLAKENNIILIDGKQFILMLLDVGLESLESFDKN